MKGDKSLMNIQFKDGEIKRVPRLEAEDVVASGKAKFVSNSVYRSLTRKPSDEAPQEDKPKTRQVRQSKRDRKKQNKKG